MCNFSCLCREYIRHLEIHTVKNRKSTHYVSNSVSANMHVVRTNCVYNFIILIQASSKGVYIVNMVFMVVSMNLLEFQYQPRCIHSIPLLSCSTGIHMQFSFHFICLRRAALQQVMIFKRPSNNNQYIRNHFCFAAPASAYNYEKNLHNALLANYSYHIRPLTSGGNRESTEVALSMRLLQIFELVSVLNKCREFETVF